MERPAIAAVHQIRFGVYSVDLRSGEITKYGTRIRLQERPFQILATLIQRHGEVVTREELRQQLWPDGTFVNFDHGISSAVNKLRGALGDTALNPKYIETVGRRGYRFLYPVTVEEQPPQPLAKAVPAAPEPSLPGRSFGKWASIALLLLLAFGASVFYGLHRSAVGQIRSVAVLPLKNLSNSADEEYFSEGLTDELITKLASLKNLQVISRTSVMRYGNTDESLPQIARELKVDAVVEGSVLRVGDRVRITVQLIQASTDRHLWAASYEREQKDILDLQNEVTRQIADNIKLSLEPAEQKRLAIAQTLDPISHEDYLRGRSYFEKRTTLDLKHAVQYFQQAIDRTPDYGQAYAGLADSYALLAAYSLEPPQELIAKARAAALKALEIDDRLAEAHTSLALIYQNYDWNWSMAEKEYRLAIALNPNYATAHHWYAEFLGFMGRFDEAYAEYAKARQLDPFSLIIRSDYAVTLMFARRYDEAVDEFRSVLAVDPGFPRALLIANAYALQGHSDQAIQTTLEWAPRGSFWQEAALVDYYSRAGDKPKALRAYQHLKKEFRDGMNPFPMVQATLAMHEPDEAFHYLDKAADGRFSAVAALRTDPTYDPVRKDPRFAQLLARVGLQH